MIMIDDAGSGSFVGGTCIGIYETQSRWYSSFVIPIEYFNDVNFQKKAYLDYAIKKITDSMALFPDIREVVLCRGYMFDLAEKSLKKKGFDIRREKIEGILQSKIEASFKDHVMELGLFPGYIKYTQYPFHFHKLLRWVLANPRERVRHCKTGWKSWKQHKNVKTDVSYKTIEYSNIYCMKCGSRIYPGEESKVISYSTNKTNYIYLHTACPQSILSRDLNS
jgi:hypothetical protein